jgi:hypothetical protein
MAIDPAISLGFQPAQLGQQFNPGATVQAANNLMAFQQSMQAQKSANALRGILSQPGAVDGTGNPSDDAMKQIMAVDPGIGMKFKQNALVDQERQLRLGVLKTDAFAKKQDMMDEGYAPLLETYEESIKAGKTPEAALVEAQDGLTKANERLMQGGFLSEDEQRRLPTKFDPLQMRQYLASSQQVRDWRKDQLQERRLDATMQHQQDLDQRADDRVNRAGWQVMTDPTAKDKDGNPVQYRYNAGTGESTTLAGNEPYHPGGAAKVGVETKAPAAGSSVADNQSVEADIKKEHPDWSAGQIALEAKARIRSASAPNLPGDAPLTDEAINYAAEIYRKTGNMPSFGMSKYGASDRRRIINQAAGNARDAGSDAGGDLVTRAVITADKGALTKLTAQRAAITSFEETAVKNGDILVDLAQKVDKTGVPVVERWLRAGRKSIEGDVDVSKFDAQLQLYGTEVAKIMTNPNLTGVLSDSARREVQEFLPKGATYEQIKGLHELLKGDFGRRTDALNNEISSIRTEMGDAAGAGKKKADVETPAKADAPAKAAPSTKEIQTFGATPADMEAISQLPKGTRFRGADGKTYETHTDPKPKSAAQPPEGGHPIPADRAGDKDGTTYNNGQWVKRGGYVVPNTAAAPAKDDPLAAARAAIAAGADREKVIARLKQNKIDPGNL